MTETRLTAEPALRRPVQFLRESVGDLAGAAATGRQLFLRNLRSQHRRSLLGYIWLFVPMVVMALLGFYLQSRRIIVTATPDMPYAVYVLTGLMLWQMFVDALTAPLLRLRADRPLITRTRLPLEALLIAGMFDVLLNATCRLVLLVIVLAVYDTQVSYALVLLPVAMLALVALGTALGVLALPLGLLYDDVGRAIALSTALWMVLTPVFYPIPDDGLLRFNPVTPLLVTARNAAVGLPPSADFAGVAAMSVIMLLLGWLLLRLARPHIVARLG